MTRRQTVPRQWLILPTLDDPALNALPRQLSRRSGVIVIGAPAAPELRRLRRIARACELTVAVEARGESARVHNTPELRKALLRGVPLILLSPIFSTNSHPDWRPISRMRAAALARLANRRLLALGGMNGDRYSKIAPLGFIGWAGISAFRT